MVYVAVPIERGGSVVGALRTSLAATAIDAGTATTNHNVLLGALFTAVMAGLASLLAARRITNPLLGIKAAASRFANGDFTSKAPLTDTEEFASLADTLNQMAARLDRQIRAATQKAGEQQAILSEHERRRDRNRR